MKFSDIPGHEDVKSRLREMVDSGNVPHALLLEGPAGTGKFALARAFVQYLHCQNRSGGEPCGHCAPCRQHAITQHIDTLYSFPVAKEGSSPSISNDYIEEFRELMTKSPFMDFDEWQNILGSNKMPVIYVAEANEIIRRMSFTGQVSDHRAVLLWLPERMNVDTANKLLKYLEEPADGTIFVFSSDHPGEILPTIYSRLQRIKVPRLSDEEVADWLVDNTATDRATAANLAPLAEGSLTSALTIVSRKDKNAEYLERFQSLMRLAYQRDIAKLKIWSETLTKAYKRENLLDFLKYVSRQLRENFVANLHNAQLNLMTTTEAAFSRNFARFVNERNVLGLVEAIDVAETDIAGNANVRIVLFDMAITVILLLKQ